MFVKNTISQRKRRKRREQFHNKITRWLYREPELLGRHAPPSNMIILKQQNPPAIYTERNTRVDVIFVYLLEADCAIEIMAIEIKTGFVPHIGEGFIQLKNTGKNFIDYWMEWFEKHKLFRKITPFTDYNLYLSLILLEEKFTKPIEEWVSYKKRFKIANIKRQDNYF